MALTSDLTRTGQVRADNSESEDSDNHRQRRGRFANQPGRAAPYRVADPLEPDPECRTSRGLRVRTTARFPADDADESEQECGDQHRVPFPLNAFRLRHAMTSRAGRER